MTEEHSLGYIRDVVSEMKEAVKELTRGQNKINVTLATLIQNMAELKRVHTRQDKAEARITSLERGQWKLAGTLVVGIPLVTLIIGKLFF